MSHTQTTVKAGDRLAEVTVMTVATVSKDEMQTVILVKRKLIKSQVIMFYLECCANERSKMLCET